MAAFRTPAKFYKLIHRIADRQIGPLERAFLKAVGIARSRINDAALEFALHQRDARAVFAALHIEVPVSGLRAAYVRIIRDTVTQAGMTTGALVQVQVDTAFRFDVVNPRPMQFAQARAADLVKQVSKDTKANIRRIIVRGFREGQSVTEMAKDIRQLAGFGLTKQQSEWGRNYRARLQDAGKLTADKIDAKVDRYAAQKLRERSITIARTESMTAANEGQRETWRQAQDEGLLTYDADLPTQYRTPWGMLDGPPAHVACRCAEATDFDGAVARRVWITAEDDVTCEDPDGGCLGIPAMNAEGVGLAASAGVVSAAAAVATA